VGRRAGAVRTAGRGRVAVGVVGVTPPQGARERLAQGTGPQGLTLQTLGVPRGEPAGVTHLATGNSGGSGPRPSQPNGVGSCGRSGATTPVSRGWGSRGGPPQGGGRPAWMGTHRKPGRSRACPTWPMLSPPATPGLSRGDAPTSPHGGSQVSGAVEGVPPSATGSSKRPEPRGSTPALHRCAARVRTACGLVAAPARRGGRSPAPPAAGCPGAWRALWNGASRVGRPRCS
jgi:hypothetical protein